MTHSLHRKGTRENLSEDFTIYCKSSRGINDAGSSAKKKQFLEIALRHNAINAAVSSYGNRFVHTPEALFDNINDKRDVLVCCGRKKDAVNIIKEVLDADIGLSIMLQGLFEEVVECLEAAGLKPHTVHHSLGIWGRTEKLPPDEVLEVTTMCGHGIIAEKLVTGCIEDVRSGAKTPLEASMELARPCVCGIFNLARAEYLLQEARKS